MKDELYEAIIKVKEKSKKNGLCSSCFCIMAKRCLENFNLKYSFLDWKAKNNISSVSCSNILFYLEDLRIIKILQGVANKKSGVDCFKLEIKVLRPFKGNKI